jgi:hypothetical protein
MAILTWDNVGERGFETGIEKGVVYFPSPTLESSPGEAWYGLIGIDEAANSSSVPYFLDGIKYLDAERTTAFQATLRAFTYPASMEYILGYGQIDTGFIVDNQPVNRFHLSYQTRNGNDTDGVDHGYKIHILWDLLATPQAVTHESVGDSIAPVEFAWDIVAQPQTVAGHKPTAHLILDSTELSPAHLALFEALYGTETTDPSLPSLQDFVTMVGLGLVIDNGDGTWTITTPDENINMISATQFEITSPDAGVPTYLDANTFTLETTEF